MGAEAGAVLPGSVLVEAFDQYTAQLTGGSAGGVKRSSSSRAQGGHVASMCARGGVVVDFRRRGSARACMRTCMMDGGPRHASHGALFTIPHTSCKFAICVPSISVETPCSPVAVLAGGYSQRFAHPSTAARRVHPVLHVPSGDVTEIYELQNDNTPPLVCVAYYAIHVETCPGLCSSPGSRHRLSCP